MTHPLTRRIKIEILANLLLFFVLSVTLIKIDSFYVYCFLLVVENFVIRFLSGWVEDKCEEKDECDRELENKANQITLRYQFFPITFIWVSSILVYLGISKGLENLDVKSFASFMIIIFLQSLIYTPVIFRDIIFLILEKKSRKEIEEE